jgi:photosystem II stability/assembly factor-like uncharacterized protein
LLSAKMMYRPMTRLAILCTLVLAVTTTATAQHWEVTSGPPAEVTCMVHIDKSTVLAGTSSSAVYRTVDYGANWGRLDNGLDDGINFYTINQMAVGAKDVVFAAMNQKGVYRSRDGGFTWEKLPLTVPSNARVSVSTRAFPDGSTHVFVGVDATVSYLKMHYSTDDGNTWSDVKTSTLPSAMSSIFEVFISPNSNKLFALVSYNKGLYRTTNFGNSWTRIDSDPSSGESDDNFRTMTADVNGHLYVGRNSLPGSAKCKNACVMKSVDDGETWSYLLNGWNTGAVTNCRITGIAFGMNQTMYASTDKDGMYFSMNRGDNWERKNDGMPGNGSSAAVVVTNRNHAFAAPIGEFVYRHLDPALSVDESFDIQRSLIAPQPARAFVNVPLNSTVDATLTAQLFNIAGAEVMPAVQQRVAAGSHTLTLQTDGLPSGVYMYRIIGAGTAKTGTITVAP